MPTIDELQVRADLNSKPSRTAGSELLWFKCANCRRSGLHDFDSAPNDCGCLHPDFKIMKKQQGYKAYKYGTLQADWIHPDGKK